MIRYKILVNTPSPKLRLEGTLSHIHIIDPDSRRRTAVFRSVLELGLHAEIYEDCGEFAERDPHEGLILAVNTEAPSLLKAVGTGDIEVPLVVYADQPATSEVVEVIQAGALDFFEWPVGSDQLRRLLNRARDSGNEMLALMRRRSAARKLVASLSAREMELLIGVLAGGSNKTIAAELGISPRTAEIHRANMMRKLSAATTGDAVRIALYAGLDGEIELAA